MPHQPNSSPRADHSHAGGEGAIWVQPREAVEEGEVRLVGFNQVFEQVRGVTGEVTGEVTG